MLLRHTFLMFFVIQYSDLYFLRFYLLVLKRFCLKDLLISVKEIKAENGEVIGSRSDSKSVPQPGIGDLFWHFFQWFYFQTILPTISELL